MDTRVEIRQMPENQSVEAPCPDRPAKVFSQDLLGFRGELIIEHNGRDYCLRLTQNGKLILTA